VVVLGAVGMNLPREPFYLKELELRLSTSYGPGRYDAEYEEQGHDYPYGYVRWTEGRNMAAFLWLLREGKVNVRALTTHRFPIEEAAAAYQLMMEGTEPYLGILLSYADLAVERAPEHTRIADPAVTSGSSAGQAVIGLIGAGNHVRDMLVPHLQDQANASLRWVCTSTGMNANALGERLRIPSRTANYRDVLADPAVNAVVIGTRHDTHASLVIEALGTGKHVFVEKPLCLSEEELAEVSSAYTEAARRGLRLIVGFNRRYSEHGRQVRDFFAGRREPLVMMYRVNAGAIPAEHWAQDLAAGGGRIIGEGCHFIDFMQYVCGAPPTTVRGVSIARHSSGITADQCVITLGFRDGSVGTLIYAAGGDKTLAKERFEAFGAGKAIVMDDFLTTEFYSGGKSRRFRTRKRDKGFAREIGEFLREVTQGGEGSMPFAEIQAVSRAAILAARSLQTGEEYTV
jgi:predicted dehydrogenase